MGAFRLLMASGAALAVIAAEYAAPAGARPALRRPGAASILPGGRIIAPIGQHHATGPGPFGLAVSPNGKTAVTANGGLERFSLTILEKDKNEHWAVRHLVAPKHQDNEEKEDDWHSIFMGLAFAGDHNFYASEGNSGRVRLVQVSSGTARRVFNVNQDGYKDSYTGDLALDADRGLLYVVDQANFRVAVVDVRNQRLVSSIKVGRLPYAIALSPNKRKLYVTNIGMFEYKPIPGADRNNARETGLPFPAFGFPSPEAQQGARRETARGPVEVPGLGDPNVREANSLCVVDVENPASPRLEAFIRTGVPFGKGSAGGSSPSAVLATPDRIFVSNAHNDSITVIEPKTNTVAAEIPLRIPGLGKLRGILPLGLAYHAASGWLLVAEAGINAIGVVDTKQMRAIGHVPTAWFPTRIALDHDTVYVTSAKGFGVGPNARPQDISLNGEAFLGLLRRGSISIFPLPAASELGGLTGRVLAANGFIPKPSTPPALPAEVQHVVMIVKENRTFDEVFGDITTASNGAVAGVPALARFGRYGYVYGRGQRFSLQSINVTPNHHKLAERWSFSDNFYADSEVSVDGHHWLVGSYPDEWTETTLMASYAGQKDFRLPTTAPGRLLFAESDSSVHPEEQPEAGTLWHHLERHGITFRNFGEGFELAGVDEGPGLKPTGGRFLTNVPMPEPLYRNTSREYPQFNMNIPDQYRASQFITEIEMKYVKGGQPFPRFLFIHLPNDHMAKPRPEDGYPYDASYVADNDFALGRIIEFLSHTPVWRHMAIFITEDDAQGGVDHIDAHRTVLLCVGPYFKQNYVSHVNSSFPGLLKTVFRLLEVPPLNLFDGAASDLSDCFTTTPDFTPYEAVLPDSRLFQPAKARDPLDGKPSPRMDDPGVIREQLRTR